MHSLDKERQRDAISAAITAIYEGPNVPEEVQATFKDVMEGLLHVILYPLTSTQLGVFSNFLDMKKLDVLQDVDSRAKDFKERFLDIFVEKHSQVITEYNQAKLARPQIFKEHIQPLMERGDYDVDKWAPHFENYMKSKEMEPKIQKLRDLFSKELRKPEEEGKLPLKELSSSTFLDKIIRDNPRFVTGFSHTFNLLGAVGATYSVLSEIFTSDSGLRQGNPRDVLSVAATAIGGVGSVKGTFDLAKVLKEKLFQPRGSTDTFSSVRMSEELVTFEESVATKVGVDLNNMERASNRLARLAKTATIGRVFTAFGVVADGIFLGISIYDLYKDFTADSVDPWKVANDFAFAASAGVGAVLGKYDK